MSNKKIQIEASWKEALASAFDQSYFSEIRDFLKQEKNAGKIIYPPGQNIFKAFDLAPINDVKVVIIGQDPYHNPDQAMGLSFSVPKGIRIPPSLKNIYKEIIQDVGGDLPTHGDLTYWAQQGVFLLNAMLTVEQNKPSSHRKIGWQHFTDDVISVLSSRRENIVFLLWGNFAKNKSILIDESKHLVLTSAHPSPLAGGAFFGNNHFSKTNAYLISHDKTPIDWQIKN